VLTYSFVIYLPLGAVGCVCSIDGLDERLREPHISLNLEYLPVPSCAFGLQSYLVDEATTQLLPSLIVLIRQYSTGAESKANV